VWRKKGKGKREKDRLRKRRRLSGRPDVERGLERVREAGNEDEEVAGELALALERENMGAEARVVHGRAGLAGSS